MRALAVVLLATMACGAGAPDPIVGRWANDRGKQVEFKAGGHVDLPLNAVDAACQDATDVIAACARQHNRWARVGSGHYRITVPAVSRRPRGSPGDGFSRSLQPRHHLGPGRLSPLGPQRN